MDKKIATSVGSTNAASYELIQVRSLLALQAALDECVQNMLYGITDHVDRAKAQRGDGLIVLR